GAGRSGDVSLRLGRWRRRCVASALLWLAGSAVALAQVEGPVLGPGPWHFDSFEQPGLQLSVVARGLDHPFGLVFVPGTQTADNVLGDVLINERSGSVRLYRNGALQDAPVADLRQ